MIPKLVLKVFFCFFLISFGLFHFTGILYSAGVNFNFDSEDELEDWEVSLHGGKVSMNEGILLIEPVGNAGFPYLSLGNLALPANKYFIEISYKFTGDTKYGFGFGLNDSLPVDNRNQPLSNSDFIFVAWPGQYPVYGIGAAPCPANDTLCQGDSYYGAAHSGTFEDWDTARLEYADGVYRLFIDNSLKFESKLSNKIVSKLWLGNFERVNNLQWGRLMVDYVRSGPLTEPPVIIPKKIPVIVIPGLGASWDVGAILGGTAGTDWEVPSFVNLYENLINSLVYAGYEKDENLFIFAYDWRKGLNDLSGDLNNYIAGLVSEGKIEADEKIDFIGHSYGGLVARTYGQRVGTEKINKIITAGSPHQGVLDAYATWEGATVWKNIWWQKAALELQTQLNQRPGENKVETVRRLSPGIKDVLPTFDFLKKDGVLIPSSSLIQKNATLTDLNTDLAAIDALTSVNGGDGKTTDRFVRVVQRGWLDRTLGLWEDGKPVSDNPFETMTEGDDSVPLISSLGNFSNKTTVNADHGGVVNDAIAIGNIFDQLGLDKTKILTNVTPDQRKSVFIAALRSPGKISVCNTANICDENLGMYLTDEKIFFLPGYNNEDLGVRVIGQGDTGSYRLHLGDLADDSARWETVSGNLKSGDQIDSYGFSASEEEITITGQEEVTQRSLEELYRQLDSLWPKWDKKNLFAIAQSGAKNKKIVAIRQLRELLSKSAISAYKERKLDRVEAIMAFWKELDKYAESVIGTSNSTKVSVLNANIRLVDGYKALAENLLRNSNSLSAGKFYLLFTERFDEAKAIRDTNRDLSLDKTLSGRYLLQTALGVR